MNSYTIEALRPDLLSSGSFWKKKKRNNREAKFPQNVNKK